MQQIQKGSHRRAIIHSVSDPLIISLRTGNSGIKENRRKGLIDLSIPGPNCHKAERNYGMNAVFECSQRLGSNIMQPIEIFRTKDWLGLKYLKAERRPQRCSKRRMIRFRKTERNRDWASVWLPRCDQAFILAAFFHLFLIKKIKPPVWEYWGFLIVCHFDV